MKLPPVSRLSNADNLLRRFEEIHNYIYANDGLSTQQTLEEFIKVLFIKIYDENNNGGQFQISSDELKNLKESGAAKEFVLRISELLEKTKKDYRAVFDADDKIKLSNVSLGFTVNKLQGISLSGSASDVKGLAFQKFLAHHEKDNRGQFFTPQPVIDFCVDIIQPRPGELIVDPACGSGGFLISSLRYILKHHKTAKPAKVISDQLVGLDINKSIARIAKMKLLLEANANANITCTNALGDMDELRLDISETIKKTDFTGFDIVLANPPFGTGGKITNSKTLAQYDLGHKWTSSETGYEQSKKLVNAQVAEILFIERCLQLLKEGGRMGIVLPNGHFENPSLEYLRYYIKQKAKVLAVVNLPQETFIPYGTGVKTSLLFLEKHTSEKKSKYPIFFGQIKKPGYQGNKNGTPIYQKDQSGVTLTDKQGNPLLDEDFSMVVKDYKTFQKKKKIDSESSFSILFNELNGRFDYGFYAPENRRLIERLKEHNAVRLGSIVDIVKTKSPLLKNPDAKVEYVELSDINTHSFEIINSTEYKVHDLPSRASYQLETGDIITAIAGNSVGSRKHATALVTPEHSGQICTNGFRVLRNFKIDAYYLLYFLKSEAFLKQVYRYRTGAAIPNVSDTDLAEVLVLIPDEKTINSISQTVKKAFRLREESRKAMEGIKLEIV